MPRLCNESAFDAGGCQCPWIQETLDFIICAASFIVILRLRFPGQASTRSTRSECWVPDFEHSGWLLV
jgi:hypothetical protein